MTAFRARQLAVIRDAVAAGREAMHADGRYDPAVFARAFVQAGGAQVPGASHDADGARALGRRLLRAVAEGRHEHPGDRDLQREVDRARNEARWAELQHDDKVVGFRLVLPEPVLQRSPTAEALAHASHGLGPGVFRKADVVVLQPDCDGARFLPVLEDEIEC